MNRFDYDAPGEIGLGIQWWWQWPELFRFRDWNWINFDPIRLAFEAGTYTGRYAEVTVVLLGVGFTLEVYKAPERDAFVGAMENLKDDHEETVERTGKVTVLEDCPNCDGMGSLFVERDADDLGGDDD